MEPKIKNNSFLKKVLNVMIAKVSQDTGRVDVKNVNFILETSKKKQAMIT